MATTAAKVARRAQLSGIYVILNDGPGVTDLARAVLDAGIRLVQYRAKGGIVAERLHGLRQQTKAYDAMLIVNDDWRAAVEFDCDGVHLGPGDDGFEQLTPVRDALAQRIIGLSCGSLDEVRAANASDVDYVGVGSVYATTSKYDAGPPIGTQMLAVLAKASRHPVAAVGGITAATIPEVRQSGAAMAAVISAIEIADDAHRAAQELLEAWRRP